ncbi:TIR domain-containing protein [Amycolatopsis sp. OK19-0408]|uniref:TIR domain-containing protein n=1 Tax=Amycolatopsis iheyensis TaxID=2945988 RepID=A0A9X2SQ24_9PSEU|nr:TIR domain-containing protein [Amycolatopsis iheyensis]MCR6490599.1 TIR domain-containing protein [Amycolatopsis iheyensis]
MTGQPLVVFISYARDPADPAHDEAVRRLWTFLRTCGIDARLDLGVADRRLDWTLWMGQQVREADYILVIASPAYRERAEGRSGPDRGRGVQWEARLIRDAFYAEQDAMHRFLPVVLPGQSTAGVPDFLAPASSTVYTVSDFTVEGAEPLLRVLTDQPEIVEPPLGVVPVLAPRPLPPAAPVPHQAPAPREKPASSGVRNVVNGTVTGTVIQAGSMGAVTIPGPLPAGPPARRKPEPRLSPNAREAFRLPLAGPADLTVRAIATLPWPPDDDLEITGRTRRRIEAALPRTELSVLTRSLDPGRQADEQWERASGPNVHQSGSQAWYEQPSSNPADGRMAVRAAVRVMLPGAVSSAITVSVEAQVSLPAPDLRITAEQIVELWTAEWDAATVVVPGAVVPDAEPAPLLGSPSIELQIKTNDEGRSLLDVVDLSVFGKSDGRPSPQGAVTVFDPIGLDRDNRRAWSAKALTRMARGWGFLDADESDLAEALR